MTGFEIVPAAAASAAKAVAAAVGEDMVAESASVKDTLAEMSRQSPSMAIAAEAQARRVAIKQAIRLKVVERVGELFGVSKDYLNNHLADDLADKMKDVPEEHIVTPSLAIAAPAIQGLSYSFDEPDLKEMYLNLLATASDDRHRGNAHPSFAETIKQLSAAEVPFLDVILSVSTAAIAQISTVPGPEGGYQVIESHILDFTDTAGPEKVQVEMPEAATYIDNWIRLGLVTVDYDKFLIAPDAYAWVETRPELARLREKCGAENIRWGQGLVRVTAYGAQFHRAVSARVAETQETPPA